MFIIYDLIFILFAVIYLPVSWLKGKRNRAFGKRLGNFETEIKDELSQHSNVWVHAVSVGEVLAVLPFLENLRARYPKYHIVFSSITPTGHALALQKLSGKATVIYAPLDLSWIVRNYVSLINPKIYISMETEIWPNLYSALAEKGVPIIQINGRISEGSFKKYRVIKGLMKNLLFKMAIFCMQSETDAQRIMALGAPEDKVKVVGNIKFDQNMNEQKTASYPKDLERYQFLLGGSTHPGEEKILLDTYKKLYQEFLDLRLIIAPRHVERVGEVEKLIAFEGFRAIRFSQMKVDRVMREEVVVLDTIGQLRGLYRLATVVFIGKTFMVGGGQNMIEPACFGKPIIVGPHTQNFKDVMDLFLTEKAIIQVRTEREMLSQVKSLLLDHGQAEEMGRRALSVVKGSQGAILKTLKVLEGFL